MSKKLFIKKIYQRKVLNSHFEWTNEFIIKLKCGVFGRGTASQGETLSIYEDSIKKRDVSKLLLKINKSPRIKESFDQKQFDDFIEIYKSKLGKNNSLALSLAFLNASCASLKEYPHKLIQKIYGLPIKNNNKFPIILCNILNGGFHAYTNPVLSDFHEFLLVPQFNDLGKLVRSFHKINREVKGKLHKLNETVVAGNPVYCYKTKDNRVWIEFLLKILEKSNLDKEFKLMIDASAGDLLVGKKYELSLTEKRKRTSEEFLDYWFDLFKSYPIQILEDPFAESDLNSWSELTRAFPDKVIAGDNLFCTDPNRIKDGGDWELASAVLIKPNQNGTLTGTARAILAAFGAKMTPITSHRSVETESKILSDLTVAFKVPIIKIGLFSDFETIIKLNQLIRLYDNKKGEGSIPAE